MTCGQRPNMSKQTPAGTSTSSSGSAVALLRQGLLSLVTGSNDVRRLNKLTGSQRKGLWLECRCFVCPGMCGRRKMLVARMEMLRVLCRINCESGGAFEELRVLRCVGCWREVLVLEGGVSRYII